MPDNGDGKKLQLIEQLGDIQHVVDQGVLPAASPLRIAVPAEIGSDNVVVVTQGECHPVPVAGMVSTTVNELIGEGQRGCPNPRSVISNVANSNCERSALAPAQPLNELLLCRSSRRLSRGSTAAHICWCT